MLAIIIWVAGSGASVAIAQATKSAPGDACSLITKEEAGTALERTVRVQQVVAARPVGPGSTVSGCGYPARGGRHLQVNLTRVSASSVAIPLAECEGKSKDGLAGLGDLACWYNDKHRELHAVKGPAFVSIEIHGLSAPTEAITGLMKKALGRLP